ncbi:hypothetical protein [Marinobacterium sedimentorum]|uniref:hypothetical protein n=1 Tax=Marinobacterium sedimentorum TaxID=2927804 RepID=UPI0020C610D0|nr:hypothetical protein [Marinobacterium sedimentorum]MCP8687201.1 hypothetical protein [Marinobacterium sedimentorum]
MTQDTSSKSWAVPGSVGWHNSQATSYWDRMLSIEEVACVLGVRITDLKHAVQHNLPLKGKNPPALNRVTNGKMYFEGHAVKAYIDS